ncbi:MAG TPA: AAA family ATPase, partial [Steroidobacteraceae bacterium]|nr:AAA family ATPase [Steroidobacteraceae bacterium]
MEQIDSLRLRFDAFELDEADARLKRDGVPIALAPKAFAVLCTLARQPGALVTKDALLDAVWGHRHVSESVLKTTISEVRAALDDDAKQPRYIETASRRGYRFIGTTYSATSSPAKIADRTRAVNLIGRQSALAKLHECWQRALQGDRQLVWIAGDAGVGKTKLVEAFLSEVSPGAIAHGQCVEHFGTGEPFLPILEAIRELCRIDPQLASIMRGVAPTWTMQMPWLIEEADRDNLLREVAGAHPDRMVREMRELMDRFTENRPLIFVLEDLHWSDRGTLHMMEHFVRRPRPVKLLWIATYRLTQVIAEEHPLRDLRHELRLHRLCEEILLEPFSESEVESYIKERAPTTNIPESFVRRLHAHTDGLPLFVANVADTLIAQVEADPTAARRMLDDSANTPLPVPDNLSGVIEKQFHR